MNRQFIGGLAARILLVVPASVLAFFASPAPGAPEKTEIAVTNRLKGETLDYVRIRVVFAFESGAERIGYLLLRNLGPGETGRIDLATATGKTSLSVARVETTVDLDTGATETRVLPEPKVPGDASEGDGDGGQGEQEPLLDKEELQNLTDFYITQINAYLLKDNQPRRKKVAKETFGGESHQHRGIRNRAFEIVEKKDSRRPFRVRPVSSPVPVLRKSTNKDGG